MKNIYLKFIFLAILSIVLQKNISAQKEVNIWYFGSGNGVNFNQECDIADQSSSINAIEGSVSISDENGNLLFYTNGGRFTSGGVEGKIWNRNHEVMYDMGTTEGGGASAVQSSIAVPKVGSPGVYYLFTMDESEAVIFGGYRGLSYFEIDMNLNNGLGEVVDYQESLNLGGIPGVFSPESLGSIMLPDGSGYWVVIIDLTSLEEAVKYYLVDANGVNYDHGQTLPSINGAPLNVGPIKFSPDGAFIGVSNVAGSFDATNGLYSGLSIDAIAQNTIGPVSGTSFSHNSRYFYAAGANRVDRYDMTASDVVASRLQIVELAETTVIRNLQLAPDGNIYFNLYDFGNAEEISLGAILCPNTESPCVNTNIYTFPGTYSTGGLPSFLDAYFASDVEQVGLEVCTDQSALQICEGEEVILTIEHYLAQTFDWSTGDMVSSISVTSPGTYTVTVSDGCCNTTVETFEILSNTGGVLDLEIQGENVICDGQPNTLSAVSSLALTYEWSTGSTEASILVSEAGLYSVTVTDACNAVLEQELEIIDQSNVEFELSLDGNLSCGGRVIASVSTNVTNIQWSTGETGEQITIEESGSYTVITENECEEIIEEFTLSPEQKLYEMPNAFTPDQDGFNDVFRPVWGCDNITSFDIKIFNRWGQKVYESSDHLEGWDGNISGSPAASDVFMYTMSFQVANNDRIEVASDVTLLR